MDFFVLIGRRSGAATFLAEYFLKGCAGDYWPDCVILMVCQVRWPEREFRIDKEQGAGDDMFWFDAAIDTNTGESAQDLWLREQAATTL